MKKVLYLLLLTHSLFGATFTIAPGVHHFGAGTGTVANTIVVNLTGGPPTQERAFVYFTMQGQLNIALPPGVTGTCSGGPCHVFTGDKQYGSGVIVRAGSVQYPTGSTGNNSFSVDPIFSTSTAGTSPSMIFDSDPLFTGGVDNIELGTRFTSDVNGYVFGIRYIRPLSDATQSHTVSLWDSNGNQIATATTSNDTPASGWNTVMFSAPVAITANTVYTASYHVFNAPFWYNLGLVQNRDYGTGHLRAVASYVESNGSCDRTDSWPIDAQSRPAAGEIGCVDLAPNGSIVSISNADATTSSFASEGCQCMIGGVGPGPYLFQNNYLSAVGLPWHHDESGGEWMMRGDYSYIRNTFHAPFSRLYGHPTSDGMRYSHRQLLEWKSGHRIYLNGNIFDGSWAEDNPASVTVVMSSLSGGGISDVNLENNTFRHVPGVIVVPNVIDGVYSQTKPAARFRFANNLIWDVNVNGPHHSGTYNSYYTPLGGFPDATGWIFQGPEGGEDVIIDHNTVAKNQGRVPALFFLNDTKVEGMQVTNNIFYFNSAYQGLGMDGSMTYPVCDNHQTGSTLASCMLPGLVWHHNLLLGDSDQATVQSWWRGFNNYVPTDPTNLSATGWFQYNAGDGSGNFRLRSNSAYVSGGSARASDGKDVGANIDALEAAEGKVTLTGVPAGSISTTAANIVFVAPDTQTCPVDYSSTDATLINNFTRVADAGTTRTRNVVLTGLTAGTTYYYRVNCAVEQPTGQFRTH